MSSSSKWPPVCHGGELRRAVGAWGERRCLASTETKPARCHTPATKSTTLVLRRGSGRRRVWSACRAHALVLRRGEGREVRRAGEGRKGGGARRRQSRGGRGNAATGGATPAVRPVCAALHPYSRRCCLKKRFLSYKGVTGVGCVRVGWAQAGMGGWVDAWWVRKN
jgi:hypothetical protein